MSKQTVAAALMTLEDVQLLVSQPDQAYPVDRAPYFGDLLNAIDVADEAAWHVRDRYVEALCEVKR